MTCEHGFIGACAICDGGGQVPDNDDAGSQRPGQSPASTPAQGTPRPGPGAAPGARSDSQAEALVEAVTRELTDQGKLIEAGFALFAHYLIPADSPPALRDALRCAYMAGAQHLFSSIMTVLDEGDEPTADGRRRLELIGVEIAVWAAALDKYLNPTRGTA